MEAAMRVLKITVLQRTKAFNLPALFDLLTSHLEACYEPRVTDVSHDCWETLQHSCFLTQESNVNPADIEKVS
jgi:hypothetical protein